MILVTAAYGNQGQRLIPLLARAGKKVRAMRAGGDLAALTALGATESIRGDASDPRTLADAMKGVETVYHIGPSLHPREREMGLAVIEAAEAAGVRHLVFSSVLHAIEDDLIQHRAKLDIERRLVSSSLAWTILQPTNYMVPAWTLPVFETKIFRLYWSLTRRQSLLVLDDFAEVAAKIVTEGEPHFAATYELSSQDFLNAHEIAAIFSSVTGCHVGAEYVDPDEFLVRYRRHPLIEPFKTTDRAVTSADLPYEFDVFRTIGHHLSRYDFRGNPNVLRWLLGREPTSVSEYIRREFARFQARVTAST